MLRFSQSGTTESKFAIRFALAGFMIAIALGVYAFYLTSHRRIGNEALFLFLCPPSIGAMALDNAGILGGIIGWLIIAMGNALLYGGIGFALGMAAKKSK
jgi:hypothetical protein